LGLFVGPAADQWFHGGSFPGIQAQLYRNGTRYTYAVITNSRTANPDAFAPEIDAAVTQALQASPLTAGTDLFPQFPSSP
jgi:hypothetical protein